MTDRLKYYERVNRRTPVVPFRAPSTSHHDQIREAAEAESLTVSQWMRRAVDLALRDRETTTE